MAKLVMKLQAFLLLTLIPMLYGCNPGAGDSSLGSLFGSGGQGSVLSTNSNIGGPGGDVVTNAVFNGASDHLGNVASPEPATALLLGGGMVALGYLQNMKKRSSQI